jgi:hypothetical protein
MLVKNVQYTQQMMVKVEDGFTEFGRVWSFLVTIMIDFLNENT